MFLNNLNLDLIQSSSNKRLANKYFDSCIIKATSKITTIKNAINHWIVWFNICEYYNIDIII